MNTEMISAKLSEAIGKSPDEVSSLLEKLSTVIRDCCADMDAVAIPGFGTFQPEKRNETVVTDNKTGKSTLIPPTITVKFKSSVVLRKKFVG